MFTEDPSTYHENPNQSEKEDIWKHKHPPSTHNHPTPTKDKSKVPVLFCFFVSV